ncbi:hypothetical protein JCM19237_5337 [Photobacterium aphoticum]|uniref:DNA gyrase subunit B n=1 Tax=Photobacterium aphoticum TaxID=754436 RepID=A0A090QKV8_9GAMM|nr:hypothetical protein JCM19237_5337 [Photobacterium aphoticum]
MRFITVLSAIALLGYPFAVYFGISQWGLGPVAAVLGILFVIRVLAGRQARLRELKTIAYLSGGAGITLAVLGSVFREHGWLMYYPVIVNALMLMLFGSSLWQSQTMIERFARLQDPDLPASGVRYTRTVTKVWCGFFVVNGAIALATCFMPLSAWTLYNGLISYLLAGLLFGGEWLIRQRVQRQSGA